MDSNEYIQLPTANKRLYDLILLKTGGNMSKFGELCDVTPQLIHRLFKIDPRRGKYPAISGEIQKKIIQTFSLANSYFTAPAKEELQVGCSPYFENATIEGGFGTGDGTESFSLENSAGVVNLPNMPIGTDIPYIKVHGRSMINPADPEHSIPDGAMLALRPANHTALNEIHWGEVYAFLTDEGAMVKKILPSEIEGNIVCASFNEGEGFMPFELPTSRIIGQLYYVAGVAWAKRWR